jgi:DNA/RNA-binding domain of Phe-tRNA-synthetase-like protein
MDTRAPIELAVSGVALGWVLADSCSCGPSPSELLDVVRGSCARAVASRESERSAARRAAVRDMLRSGSYKPTGRGKPASEYLLNAAAEGSFPFINAAVDINNLVSVESLLPISLVDLDRAGAASFRCRRGLMGESYAFNPSGQVLDLGDLLLVSRLPSDEPCATPVKDSQATKTHDGTTRILGVVYAPDSMLREAEAAASRVAELFSRFCGARTVSGRVP